MSKQWRVVCGYRLASAFPAMSMVATHRDTVHVIAATWQDARQEAIAAVYAKHSGIEHVRPIDCVLVESPADQEAQHLAAIEAYRQR